MKFIADENLGVQVPEYLQSLGFDIVSVTKIASGRSDIEILEISNQENRILITQDKDFGELVFKEKLIHSGVILLRLKDGSVKNKKKILLKLMESGQDFSGKFTVIRDKTESIPDIITLQGSFKTNKKASPAKIRQSFERYLSKRHLK